MPRGFGKQMSCTSMPSSTGTASAQRREWTYIVWHASLIPLLSQPLIFIRSSLLLGQVQHWSGCYWLFSRSLKKRQRPQLFLRTAWGRWNAAIQRCKLQKLLCTCDIWPPRPSMKRGWWGRFGYITIGAERGLHEHVSSQNFVII